MSIDIYSPDDLFLGEFNYELKLGNNYTEPILVTGAHGNKTIILDFSISTFKDIILIIKLQVCEIGEAYIEDEDYCQPCDAFSYNFHPDEASCQECPNGASCTGDYVVPIDGYWHASPCSAYFYKCVYFGACQWQNRKIELNEFSNELSTCNLTNIDYNQLQCEKVSNFLFKI